MVCMRALWRAYCGMAAGLCAVLGVWASGLAVPSAVGGAQPTATKAVTEQQAAGAAATARLNPKQQKILKALVGRWKIEDGEDELEFRPDGSFLGKSHMAEMTARYEISPDGKLIIDLGLPVPRKAQTPAPSAATTSGTPTPRTLRVVREVRFEGKKLVLYDRDTKQTFRYRRLR